MATARDRPWGDVAPDVWDAFVSRRANPQVLQTSPWGALKSRFGWEARILGTWENGDLVAGAQVLFRALPGRLGRLAYVPRGPLVNWQSALHTRRTLDGLHRAVRARGAIAMMVEPQLSDGLAQRQQLIRLGFEPAPLTVQPRRTIVIDIGEDEQAILKAMKSKTRYNIRLAGRRGVTVREGRACDLEVFCALMGVTGERDDFGVHSPAYYGAAFELFAPRGWVRLLIAEVEGEAVAAVMAFALPPNSWYLYGASGDAHREKMPNYLLQWRAIEWAKSIGCISYDLWGVPDHEFDVLEEQFTKRSDGLWGVYRFKRGFGGALVRTVGAWDYVYAPLRYRVYRLGLRAQRNVLSGAS